MLEKSRFSPQIFATAKCDTRVFRSENQIYYDNALSFHIKLNGKLSTHTIGAGLVGAGLLCWEKSPPPPPNWERGSGTVAPSNLSLFHWSLMLLLVDVAHLEDANPLLLLLAVPFELLKLLLLLKLELFFVLKLELLLVLLKLLLALTGLKTM